MRDGVAPRAHDVWAPRLRWLALAAAIAVLLTYWPLLVGQVLLQRDNALWTFPARWFVHQALRAGQFPAWNPYQGLGFPVLADTQYALFYPPHWLFLLVPESLVAHLTSWLGLAHLIWGGMGMALLARRLGACPIGATLAALTWSLSGHINSAWLVGTLLLGQAWIPWVAWGFLGLARNEGRSPLVGAVWPLALSLLAGEVFMTAMAMIFAVVVVLASEIQLRPRRAVATKLAKGSAAWLLAVGIAAVAWLPPLLMLKTTERARPFDRGTAEMYSHHPLRVLEMVMPGALGHPLEAYPAGQWVGEPQAAGAPLLFSSYLGIASFGLALLGLRRGRRELVLGGLAFLALLLSFGKHTPVHQVWRMLVFPLSHMHSPEKYVVLVVAALSPLAGLGTTRLLSANEKPGLPRLLVLAGLLALLALTAPLFLPAVLVSDVRAAGLPALLSLGLLLTILLLRRRFPGQVGPALLALVALDLALFAHRPTGFGSASVLTQVPLAATIIMKDRGDPAPPRLYREPDIETATAPHLAPTWEESQQRSLRSLIPNVSNVFGLAAVPGYEAAIPDSLSLLGPKTFEDLSRLLSLFSVRYALLTDAGAHELRASIAATSLSNPLPETHLLRLDGALPRVYMPGRVLRMTPAEAATYLRDDDVVTGKQALFLTAETASLVWPEEGSEPQACMVKSFENTYILAFCSAANPTIAVFAEQYDQGWSATVDGQPAPLVRANLLLRGVPLSRGFHRIELTYRAPGLRPGLALSLLGLLAAVVLWRRERRKLG